MPDPTDAAAAAPVAAPESAPAEPAAAPAGPAEPVAEAAAPEAVSEPAAEATETPENPAETAEAAEAAPEGEKPAEAEAVGEAAQPAFPTYEPFKLPEGVTLTDERGTALNNMLGKMGLSQEHGQEIVNFGAGLLQEHAKALEQHQHDVFAETRRNWRNDFEKTAGNRRNTLLGDANHALVEAFPNAKDREALQSVLAFTGVGDHPLMIRAFAALGKKLREPSAPLPGIPARQPQSAADRRYGRQS